MQPGPRSDGAGKGHLIADMATFPWHGHMVLSVQKYRNVDRWVETTSAREAVQSGRIVNLTWESEEHRVSERHEAADMDMVRALIQAEGRRSRRTEGRRLRTSYTGRSS